MRKRFCFKLYFALFLSLFCQPVFSLSIESGLWWNDATPTEDGRGFSIEQKGEIVVFTAYLYDDTGNPLWYQAVLNETTVADEYTGDLQRFEDGQTATGSFQQKPISVPEGSISLKFTDASHATLNWFNVDIPITVFESGLDDSGSFSSGLWWNDATPTEDGRGFTILQADKLVIFTAYLFGSVGEPIWYQAVLDPTTAVNEYTGVLNRFENGQTATGIFEKAPDPVPEDSDMTLKFVDATHATLNWFDTDIPITFFEFGAADPADPSQPADPADPAAPVVPPETKPSIVRFITSMGEIDIVLNTEKAPETTKNFLAYVRDDFYNNTVFHHVEKDFIVQGGGYKRITGGLELKTGLKTEIDREYNGLSNLQYTIGMARKASDSDSAQSQFYFNLQDNSADLDEDETKRRVGYTVFGKVIKGTNVLDEMGKVSVKKNQEYKIPETRIFLNNASVIDN